MKKTLMIFSSCFFLSPHNKVGLPLLPHHPLHFEWNAKTMKLLCSTSVIFSYVNFIYQINIFFFHCHDCKEIQPVPPKGNQSWAFTGRIDVEVETPILWPPDAKSWLIWKDPDAGKDWGRRRDDRGWDGWIASRTQWTWVWVNSGSWWWTGRPGVLWSMGLQRVKHDWATELNWTKLNSSISTMIICDFPLLQETGNYFTKQEKKAALGAI